MEWDDLLPLACAAYNFMAYEHSKESPFFLMFGRDLVLPLNTLLEPKIRYMGTDINIISLESMKNLYEIVATNLKLAQEKGDPQKQPRPTKLQPGDTVLIQNHTRGPFEPKYVGDYRVVSLKGNQVEIQPAIDGKTEMKHIKHVKYVLPADKCINQLQSYAWFGRKTTLRINPHMAHTKQTSRNPVLERPLNAMGVDIQEKRAPMKPATKKIPIGGKQPCKHISHKTLK